LAFPNRGVGVNLQAISEILAGNLRNLKFSFIPKSIVSPIKFILADPSRINYIYTKADLVKKIYLQPLKILIWISRRYFIIYLV